MLYRNTVLGVVASTVTNGLGVVAAHVPMGKSLVVRTAPNMDSEDTLLALRQSVADIPRRSNETPRDVNSSTLDFSWNDVTLISLDADDEDGQFIEVTCTDCYIKGTATADISLASGTDFETEIYQPLEKDIKNDLGDMWQNVTDWIDHSVSDVRDFDFNPPPLVLDMYIDPPEIPDIDIQLGMQDLDIYLEMNTVLSAEKTWSIPLFTSNPIALALGKESKTPVGVTFSVELYAMTGSEDINMSSGIHVMVETLGFNMRLFDSDIPDMIFEGGQFEFLPATVNKEVIGGSLKTGLRLIASVGLETPDLLESVDVLGISVEPVAGAAVSLFANIAEFETNITSSSSSDCKLGQSFEVNIGAEAGASLALPIPSEISDIIPINSFSFGPVPTSIPIYSTSLPDIICDVAAPTITDDDQGMSTTSTVLSDHTMIATSCNSTGLVNCPISLQSPIATVVDLTRTMAVPSGEVVGQLQVSTSEVTQTSGFGSSVVKMGDMKGSPTAFMGNDDDGDSLPLGDVNGTDVRLIVGLAVGLGVPFLIAIGVGLYFCTRKPRRK